MCPKKTALSRLSATTIVETIVAMLLVFIAFGVGISVYLNVLRNDAFVLRSKAASILEKLAVESKAKDRLIDEQLEINDFRIEKKVTEAPQRFKDLYLLSLEAFDAENRSIYQLRELVYYPETIE